LISYNRSYCGGIFAATPRILSSRRPVELSKSETVHATVDRRAHALFDQHFSSRRRMCRICIRGR
jgi:hypothetical protein